MGEAPTKPSALSPQRTTVAGSASLICCSSIRHQLWLYEAAAIITSLPQCMNWARFETAISDLRKYYVMGRWSHRRHIINQIILIQPEGGHTMDLAYRTQRFEKIRSGPVYLQIRWMQSGLPYGWPRQVVAAASPNHGLQCRLGPLLLVCPMRLWRWPRSAGAGGGCVPGRRRLRDPNGGTCKGGVNKAVT